MELRYRLTRDEHQQFWKLAQERIAAHSTGPFTVKAATTLFPLVTLLLTLFVLYCFLSYRVIDQIAFGAAALAYGWGLISMQLCGWFWRSRFWANALPDDSASLGDHRLKLGSDAIECSDQTKVTTYSWRAFSDISEHDNFVVLWFDRAAGLLVPARALANEDMRQNFISLAREHIAPA